MNKNKSCSDLIGNINQWGCKAKEGTASKRNYRNSKIHVNNNSNQNSSSFNPTVFEYLVFKSPGEEEIAKMKYSGWSCNDIFRNGLKKKSENIACTFITENKARSFADANSQPLNVKRINNTKFKNIRSKFFGTESRFDDRKDLFSKYSPGPGEYSPHQKPKNASRYSSLFSCKNTPSLDVNKSSQNLGPGYYDIQGDISNEGKNCIFGKEKKFSKHNSIFCFQKDYNNGPKFGKVPSSFRIKYKNNLSPFFILEKKPVNLEKKYLSFSLEKDEEKRKTCFVLKNCFPKNKGGFVHEKLQRKLLRIEKEEKKKKESIPFEEKERRRKKELLDFQRMMMAYATYNPHSDKGMQFNVAAKESFIGIKNHVPGPCYYNYENILQQLKKKKFFHSDSSSWI